MIVDVLALWPGFPCLFPCSDNLMRSVSVLLVWNQGRKSLRVCAVAPAVCPTCIDHPDDPPYWSSYPRCTALLVSAELGHISSVCAPCCCCSCRSCCCCCCWILRNCRATWYSDVVPAPARGGRSHAGVSPLPVSGVGGGLAVDRGVVCTLPPAPVAGELACCLSRSRFAKS